MGARFKKRAAWIVEWELHRRDSPIHDLHPHILPHRWQSNRVFDYMRCLYWNSALWASWETLDQVNRTRPQGVFILNEGPRLVYGVSTVLVACRVGDLTIEEDASGKCVMSWTMPAGLHFDRDQWRVVPRSEPFPRRLEFKDWHSETGRLPVT